MAAALGGAFAATPCVRAGTRALNVIVIYCDDLGYGDLGCYGSRLKTPNLDSLAEAGMRFTHFYSASAVCSPSRAALLTGRYPTRVDVPGVLDPNDTGGLSLAETTLPQMLKSAGYRTKCVGKWHLGTQAGYLPTDRGFDEYFGIPYSHDMNPRVLMRNTDVIEQPARLDTLTQRYTDEAVQFIGANQDRPFFLYLAQPFPHIPLAASPRFRGKSGLGMYGDVIAELDWGVGEILRALRANGLEDNTLILFSSDNGPWYQGSAGRLRGRKGETYDGGFRVPLIARLPGQIPAGQVCEGLATTMDFLPTLARLCNAPLPSQPLDGMDIWPLLTGRAAELTRPAFLYFDGWNIQCARLGKWKLHLTRYNSRPYSPTPSGGRMNLPLCHPELYDLSNDGDESFDEAPDNLEIVAEIQASVAALLPTFPEVVQTVWRDTMNRRVQDTPAGSLPEAG